MIDVMLNQSMRFFVESSLPCRGELVQLAGSKSLQRLAEQLVRRSKLLQCFLPVLLREICWDAEVELLYKSGSLTRQALNHDALPEDHVRHDLPDGVGAADRTGRSRGEGDVAKNGPDRFAVPRISAQDIVIVFENSIDFRHLYNLQNWI